MKKLHIVALSLGFLFLFQACEENELVFKASTDPNGISFSNTFSPVYLLSEDTRDNTAERFVWDDANFGAPTNVTYDLHVSLQPDLSGFEVIGSTSEKNFAVSVGQLLDFAEDLGLDDDPSTLDSLGNVNNVGAVYFQLRAYPGAGTGNSLEILSPIQTVNIEWIEKAAVGGACDPIFVVGAAAVDAGWGWGSPVILDCQDDVFQTKINLTNDAFRFFTIEGDWGSGLNYSYYEGEGYTIDANFENANDNDNNFQFTGTPGIYLLVVDGVNKTITLAPSSPLWLVGAATPGGWDWAGATEAPEVGVDTWETTLDLSNETFRFFTIKDDWGSGLNYPYYEGEGFTIDANFENAADGDSNFRFIGTPGTYTLSVNVTAKTISLN